MWLNGRGPNKVPILKDPSTFQPRFLGKGSICKSLMYVVGLSLILLHIIPKRIQTIKKKISFYVTHLLQFAQTNTNKQFAKTFFFY